MEQPVDLIVTWVDGNDPAWQKQKAEVLKGEGDQRVLRYRDWGLLQYWFRGVEQFLPWVNKIHFVTWGHLPGFLRVNHPKLHVVKHDDFIPPEYLPTFNSNVIEMNLFRMKELSEQFILCNDDTYFIRPIALNFFFRNGLPVDCALQNVLQFHRADGIDCIIANNLLALNQNFRKRKVMISHQAKWFSPRYGAKALQNLYLFPFSNFTGFEDPHLPYGCLKSVFTEVYQACKIECEETFSHRIRSRGDINHWLCRYWQFATARFCPGSPHRGTFLVIGQDNQIIKRILHKQTVPMVCLSDDNEMLAFEEEKQFLQNLFEEVLPQKSSYEI